MNKPNYRSLQSTFRSRLAKASLVLSAICFVALPAGAQSLERLNRLQGARNLVITVNGGNSYYYLVSTANPHVMELKDGQLTIGNDTYDMRSISMRMKTLPRFALDEDSTTFNGKYTVDHGLLAFRTTMSVGHWNTIIVPFSLTGYQILDSFGDESRLATIKGISGDGSEATVEFQTIDLATDDVVLQAGVAYLLKPSREPDIAESSQTPIVYGSGRIKGPAYIIPNVSLPSGVYTPQTKFFNSDDKQLKIGVLGTYKMLDGQSQITPGSNTLFAMNGAGQFYQLMGPTTMKAFRSWIRDASKVDNVKFRFVVDGIGTDVPEDLGVTTGVAEIENERMRKEDAVYDLQGRRIKTPLSALKPQIVIINGRKVVVK